MPFSLRKCRSRFSRFLRRQVVIGCPDLAVAWRAAIWRTRIGGQVGPGVRRPTFYEVFPLLLKRRQAMRDKVHWQMSQGEIQVIVGWINEHGEPIAPKIAK